MCLASIDTTTLETMNEGVIDVCDCCGGDRVIEYTSGRIEKCEHCNGEGFVLVAAEPADDDWMEESLT